MGVTNQPERGWKTAKRKRIMETGFNIFSERGIEAVTMPEVAEASGVSRATLYRYFPTKLDLVSAIGLETWADYINYRTGAGCSRDPCELDSGGIPRLFSGFLYRPVPPSS